MTAVAQAPKLGPRGRSHQPGIYAGRYLTKRKRERMNEADDERLKRRAQFLKGRDVAYRRALGIRDDEPLPDAIGQTVHGRDSFTRKDFAA